jgi:hypothetical protein
MNSTEEGLLAAPLSHRVAAGEPASGIADAVVSTWQEIATALSPLIGERGVAALYKRSLFLTTNKHPWLASAYEGLQGPMNLPMLNAAMSQQTSASAASGGTALFQTFYELLTSLVGASLTERLLHPVWTDESSAPSQDTPP